MPDTIDPPASPAEATLDALHRQRRTVAALREAVRNLKADGEIDDAATVSDVLADALRRLADLVEAAARADEIAAYGRRPERHHIPVLV